MRLSAEHGQVEARDPFGVDEEVHLDDLPFLIVMAATENGLPSRMETAAAAPFTSARRAVPDTPRPSFSLQDTNAVPSNRAEVSASVET
ncbi:MAG TPA: hypothetical protein VNN79_13190 [Actinomycetota bacterium]|nr:hypothetical protein [Actinomycetota bacterium]